MGTHNPNYTDHIQRVSQRNNVVFKGRDAKRASGVDKRLVKLMSDTVKNNPLPKGYRIQINEGLRTKQRQRKLVASGASQTMNSKHLTGNALDIAIIKPDGSYSKNFADYRKVANFTKKLAQERGLNMTWGGDWKTLRDGPHFQLNTKGGTKFVSKGGDSDGNRETRATGTGFTNASQKNRNLLAAFAGRDLFSTDDNDDELEDFSDNFGTFILAQHNDFIKSVKLELDAATPDIDQLLERDNG